MEDYKNLSGNSGVARYEIGSDFIKVMFQDGEVYLYTCASAGGTNVEIMKQLAMRGIGLCTYISQHVHGAFEAKVG